MSSVSPHPEPVPSASLPERLATLCLCGGAIVGPIALGATGAWARLGLEGCATAAVVLWAFAGPRSRRLALVPLAVAGVACLQILPLPVDALRLIAPGAAAAWQGVLPGGWGTVSVDPGISGVGIRRLLLGLATVAAVADLGRARRARGRFVAATVAAGLLVWMLGIVFPVDPWERVLLGCVDLKGEQPAWKTALAEPVQTAGTCIYESIEVGSMRYFRPAWSIGDGCGSYVNSNHFANAICLTFPVACGLWLFLTAGRLPGPARHGVAAAAAIAAVVTVRWLADSRAGAASVLLAALVFACLAAPAGLWKRLADATLGGYAAFLLAFCLVFFGPLTVVERLLPAGASFPVRGLRSDGRVVATRVAGQMLATSPLLGTGLGTFGELQPRYLGHGFRLNYAHNDYVQLLAETGIVGGSVAIGLAGLLLAGARRFLRSAVAPDRLLDAGPWAALAGLALHSAFDWSLHVPANAFIAAIIAGLALASGGGERLPRTGAVPPPDPIGRRAARVALAAACVASFALLARDASTTVARRRLATAIVGARGDAAATSAATTAALDAALATGAAAAARDPADARLARLLGQAALHRAARGSATAGPSGGDAEAWFARARRACPLGTGGLEPLAPAGAP